jgi:hypothetical protein
VVGYLPGTVKSDQLIVIGAHYDKWWYGATDNSAGIGQMLSLAKSLINSGYKPNHTIAFVAFGAEEYGWTSTNFDWLIGSYSHLKRNHPDWPGKTLAFFNFDDGAGLLGAKTILANGSPETYNFRKNMTSVFDNYFSHTLPWSAYYLPAKAVYNLPSTDFDEFSFGSAGISTMNVISTDSQIDFDSVYHTQLDNMDIISAESLGLATIANGLTVIRLDRSNILPYNLENWATDLSQQLEFKKIKTMGIDIKPINSAIQEFKKVASRVWTKIQNSNSTKKDQINSLLLDAEKKLASALVTVGGYDEALYPHEQYQTDAWALKSAQDALVKNDLETALDSLQEVYGLYEGVKVSRPVYKEMVINRHNSNRSDLFWATGKLARFIDFYDQYFLIEENGNTRKNMTLIRVAFDQAVKNLTGAINTEIAVLNQATALLLALEKLLP